jgi:hypothetical protein
VSASAVVEGFDEAEEHGSGLPAGGETVSINELGFEGAPVGFHGGVDVEVVAAAHGGHEVGSSEGVAEVPDGVLDAAGGVEKYSERGLAVKVRSGDGAKHVPPRWRG